MSGAEPDAGRGFGRRVTAVILTYNEAPNIERVLARLDWVAEVVVLDSGSDDDTRERAVRHPRVRWVERAFDTQAEQWRHAVFGTAVRTDWVLALDADYVLTPELVEEMVALRPPEAIDGYVTRFVYCIGGRRLRGTLYPPHVTLFRTARSHYEQDGHTQRLLVAGATAVLRGAILHDDRKSLRRWLWSQERYATLNARRLLDPAVKSWRLQDRLRRWLVVTPWLMPCYSLFVAGGILDGWPGLYYALQRGAAELILSLKIVELRLRGRDSVGT
jgi:glycosyltransferase involved in cell wall biosynthesis